MQTVEVIKFKRDKTMIIADLFVIMFFAFNLRYLTYSIKSKKKRKVSNLV